MANMLVLWHSSVAIIKISLFPNFCRFWGCVCEIHMFYCIILLHHPLCWNIECWHPILHKIDDYFAKYINMQKTIFNKNIMHLNASMFTSITISLFWRKWGMRLQITKWTFNKHAYFLFWLHKMSQLKTLWFIYLNIYLLHNENPSLRSTGIY